MRRLSATVRRGKSRRFSGTWAMPAARMRCAGRFCRARPSSATVPELGFSMPEMTRSSVVLPAPLGPITATASPASTSSEMPNSAANEP